MKVAIAGYGQEGEANYKYWHQLGAQITIFDEKEPSRTIPEEAQTHIGENIFSNMNGFDLVVRTAGLNPDKIKTDGKIWSATNEFFAKCPAPIIGVTGTKGKGTTSTLIAEILKAAGKTVHLLGNIGTPALSKLVDITSDDIVVFELSSFQLWDLEKSPETAVVLMIEADHMDIHTSMDQYVNAKAQIGTHQSIGDLMVYHPSNSYSMQIASESPAEKKRYQTPEGAYVNDDQIIIDTVAICKTSEVGLLGAHNLENICAAITAAWKYTHDGEAVKRAVVGFKGLEHRLELVRELDGVRYYNDSFSSAPGATIAAVRAFNVPEIIICGGYDKGVEFNQLAKSLASVGNIKKIVLIGQTRQKIAEALVREGVREFEIIDSSDFKQIVEHCRAFADSGDVVLLSPGCASFDMFKNFYDRGEQFKTIVGNL